MTTKLTIVVATTPVNDIAVSLWPTGCARDGIHTAFHLPPEQARELIKDMQAALDRIPRVGTPADLGCEVL